MAYQVPDIHILSLNQFQHWVNRDVVQFKTPQPIRVIHRNGNYNTYRAGDQRLGGSIKGAQGSIKRIFSSLPYVTVTKGFHI